MKTKMAARLPLILGVVVAGGLGATFSGEPEAKGPLADRPSKPGPHLEKIKALGGNAWLNLGKPAPDQKYGAAQGRSWSRKMAFAPDLRGAFLFGEGVHHGTTMRNGKKCFNDDLYFYDINAHAWVCAYPGTPLDAAGKFDADIKLDPATKLNVDKDGNVVPVGQCVHAYWTPEYDTDRKMFMFMPTSGPFGFVGNPNWSSPWAGGYSPYYYDPRTGKWERRKATPCAGGQPDIALFYSPKLKKPVYFHAGVWLYDHEANAWKKVGGGPPRGGSCSGAACYDSKRDQVYAVGGPCKRNEKGDIVSAGANVLEIYDIGTNKWTKPETTGESGEGAASHSAFLSYDSVSDVVVLYVRSWVPTSNPQTPDKAMHYVYDPKALKWTMMPDTFPEKKVGWEASSGFYDPETNAHFYFNAGDSGTQPGNMWVYRYARGAGR